MKIMFTVEDRKACNWDEVKKTVMKSAPELTKDTITRTLIETTLSLIEFVILSKAMKTMKEAK